MTPAPSTTARSPRLRASVHRVAGDGDGLDEGPACRVVVLQDAVRLARARDETPGERAGELDADHLEPLAAVVGAAAALRALAALERRLDDDERTSSEASRPAPSSTMRPTASWPCTSGKWA